MSLNRENPILVSKDLVLAVHACPYKEKPFALEVASS